jgi:hypothetical protein
VLVSDDLTQTMPAVVSRHATALRQAREAEWPGQRDSSAERISAAIDTLRKTVLDEVRQLD